MEQEGGWQPCMMDKQSVQFHDGFVFLLYGKSIRLGLGKGDSVVQAFVDNRFGLLHFSLQLC